MSEQVDADSEALQGKVRNKKSDIFKKSEVEDNRVSVLSFLRQQGIEATEANVQATNELLEVMLADLGSDDGGWERLCQGGGDLDDEAVSAADGFGGDEGVGEDGEAWFVWHTS